MKKPLFTGSGVAIVTPFTKETVDLPTLGKLLDFQMKNGTDATTFSILTARAFTGKKKTMFLRGYYHGNDPWAMKADYPGVLPEEVANNLVVPWFDLPAMEAAYDACGGDVAALIAQPYDHGNFADNRCATKEFWASVRQFCDKRGIVLIIPRNPCPNPPRPKRLRRRAARASRSGRNT